MKLILHDIIEIVLWALLIEGVSNLIAYKVVRKIKEIKEE